MSVCKTTLPSLRSTARTIHSRPRACRGEGSAPRHRQRDRQRRARARGREPERPAFGAGLGRRSAAERGGRADRRRARLRDRAQHQRRLGRVFRDHPHVRVPRVPGRPSLPPRLRRSCAASNPSISTASGMSCERDRRRSARRPPCPCANHRRSSRSSSARNGGALWSVGWMSTS
jgi:hypothetical protein